MGPSLQRNDQNEESRSDVAKVYKEALRPARCSTADNIMESQPVPAKQKSDCLEEVCEEQVAEQDNKHIPLDVLGVEPMPLRGSVSDEASQNRCGYCRGQGEDANEDESDPKGGSQAIVEDWYRVHDELRRSRRLTSLTITVWNERLHERRRIRGSATHFRGHYNLNSNVAHQSMLTYHLIITLTMCDDQRLCLCAIPTLSWSRAE